MQILIFKESTRLWYRLANSTVAFNYGSIIYQSKPNPTIEEKKTAKVEEGIRSEYVAIVNYCVIALMQLSLIDEDQTQLSSTELESRYDEIIRLARDLMMAKNHDYGEAWRQMRLSSLTDLILMKIERVKQIENNQGNTLASEGVAANYQDMLNYAVFALIRIHESDS